MKKVLFHKNLWLCLLLILVATAWGCAPGAMNAAPVNGGSPSAPKYQFKELKSDSPPVFLNCEDRKGRTFVIHGDPDVSKALADLLVQKGLSPAQEASDATFVIELRPGYVGSFKDYPDAPHFANELGDTAAAAAHSASLASGSGFGKADSYADLAGSAISLLAKASEYANTPNVYVGELDYRITEHIPGRWYNRHGRTRRTRYYHHSMHTVQHEGMFRTSVSGVGLTPAVALPALKTHMGQLVADIF